MKAYAARRSPVVRRWSDDPYAVRLTPSAIVAGAQPADVVADRSVGVVAGLVAGVRPEPGDVQVDVVAGSVRVAARGQVEPGAGDGLPDRRDDVRVGGRVSTRDVVGP